METESEALVPLLAVTASGTLTLNQTAIGGIAGNGSMIQVPADVTVSNLAATNPGGGDLIANSTAIGGAGNNGTHDANGGNATNTLSATTTAVNANVTANGCARTSNMGPSYRCRNNGSNSP